MKIAISVPDDVFEPADELAEELGISRSELYATAVAEYLAKHRAEDITARLNDVYAQEPSGLPPQFVEPRPAALGSLIGSPSRRNLVDRPLRAARV